MYVTFPTLLTFVLAIAAAAPTDESRTADLEPRGITINKPTGSNRLGFCDRYDGENCWIVDQAAGAHGEGPCIKWSDSQSRKRGVWPSVDLNCTMFSNNRCKFKLNGKDQQTVPLNDWGWDDLTLPRWSVEGFTGELMDTVPRSIFCWLNGKTKGLGKESYAD